LRATNIVVAALVSSAEQRLGASQKRLYIFSLQLFNTLTLQRIRLSSPRDEVFRTFRAGAETHSRRR